MSKLEFDFESFNRIKDGYELTKEDAYKLATNFRYTSDKLFETEAEKLEFREKLFIENVWCFGDKSFDLFQNSRKATLDEFFG